MTGRHDVQPLSMHTAPMAGHAYAGCIPMICDNDANDVKAMTYWGSGWRVASC